MSTLETAIIVATKSHRNQKDKDGSPYILHPIRVMMKVQSEEERIVAILHDVIEKGGVKLLDLKELGFSENIVNAIDHLSKKDNEPYLNYIERSKQNSIALKVKIADIEDKIQLIKTIKQHTEKNNKTNRYHTALSKLKE